MNILPFFTKNKPTGHRGKTFFCSVFNHIRLFSLCQAKENEQKITFASQRNRQERIKT